jgi:hypothetical protein
MTSEEFTKGLEKIGAKLIEVAEMNYQIQFNNHISKYMYSENQNTLFLTQGGIVQTIKLDECKLYTNDDSIEVHNSTVYITIFNL